MSDVRKFVKKTADSKQFAAAEKHERAEGVRDALKAGRGDVVAGAKKLHMQKEGLPAAEKRAAKTKSGAPGRQRR